MAGIADKAVSMMIDLKTDAKQIITPLKTAFTAAGVGGMVAAFKSPEFNTKFQDIWRKAGDVVTGSLNKASSWFTSKDIFKGMGGAGQTAGRTAKDWGSIIGEKFAGLKGMIGEGWSNFMGPGAMGALKGAGSAGYSLGKWGLFSKPGQIALGGLLGGPAGAISAIPNSMGRMFASIGGGAVGGMVGGVPGSIGGAIGGAMGGVGGAALGIAAGSAAGALYSLAKAGMAAADTLSSWVGLTDPHAEREYQRASADLTAALGDGMKPIVIAATGALRDWADLLVMMKEPMRDFANVVGDVISYFSPKNWTYTPEELADEASNMFSSMFYTPEEVVDEFTYKPGDVTAGLAGVTMGAYQQQSYGLARGNASFSSVDDVAKRIQLAAFSGGGTDPAKETAENTGTLVRIALDQAAKQNKEMEYGGVVREMMAQFTGGA